MTRKKRSYTTEFKQDSISLVNEIGVSKASDELGVLKSTLQSWLNKNIVVTNPKEDVDWKTEAKRLKKENGYLKPLRGRYGSPRLTHYLKNNGLSISENTVAKIIKKEGLNARKRRKIKALPSEKNICKNTSKRIFFIKENNNPKVNEVRIGDITYIPFNNKFLYLSVVMILKRRKIVGWSLDLSLS